MSQASALEFQNARKMKLHKIYLCFCLVLGGLGGVICASAAPRDVALALPTGASSSESLAAREARRYLYLRTGQLLDIIERDRVLAAQGGGIVIATKAHAQKLAATLDPALAASFVSLEPQEYRLKTVNLRSGRTLFVVGGDDVATLYATYRLAEHLGVRFYLHGDVLPDERVEFEIPVLDERAAPLFALRGIQPFHDFPEGPDWWNTDDYLAVLGQLPKLRMNFFGLHTYPEGAPNAEPTVWIGQPSDIGDVGKVKFSYPSSYQNTLRGNWGYAPTKTGDYIFGSAQLFARDDFGPEVMSGHLPGPKTPEASNEVFDQTTAMLHEAFGFAHQLGIKTCVGMETPLVIPQLVKERLTAAGKNPADLATVQELYEGIFRRAAQAHPLDYYWLWTPEGWTWSPVAEKQIAATTNDLLTAFAALKKTSAPFKLATCGWVLGPQQDRAMFDKVLPKEVAVSCINRQVGNTPVDAGFADVSGRGKWAIPWLEDDPGLNSAQLWVGRMRRDAFDARRYGCDGLMGIHWRTRVLSMNIGALAAAAWEQGDWAKSYKPNDVKPEASRVPGPVGGNSAGFPDNPIADTEDQPLYQTVRYDVKAYRLPATNGPYAVTLKFCEPHYDQPGTRVFDVKLQGKTVIRNLDILAKAGKNRALDFTFTNIIVNNGWLDIDFVPRVEFPSIAAIVVTGNGFTWKINCGGPAYKDYVADLPGVQPPPERVPATKDFYDDWTLHQFGSEIAPRASAIFQKLDHRIPRACDWVDGPGGIKPDGRPWAGVAKQYTFVDDFAALRSGVRGAGNLERFDYWLNMFRYMRANAELNCSWAEYNRAWEKVKAEKDNAAQKRLARETTLPQREKLVRLLGVVYEHLLATVSTPGELGSVANWNQHILPSLLTKPGEELAKVLGEPLPPKAQPSHEYHGPPRVIVPTLRTSLRAEEPLRLKVLVLSEQPAAGADFFWRELGKGQFKKLALWRVARGVYEVALPPDVARGRDLEYYVRVETGSDKPVLFPATAPSLNQTVIRLPAGDAL